MLEGNGESIFVSTSVDQDLQCTEAYVVDDEIDPDDENIVYEPSELTYLFIQMQHVSLHLSGAQRHTYLAIFC
jgi:hypothetical protein